MLELSLPWWELLLRGAAVYLMVLVLLRLAGKRQVGDLTPFDLVLLLLISEGVSNAIRADENSIFVPLSSSPQCWRLTGE